MITTTFIFGTDAVARYNDTDKVPSQKWLNKNGGTVLQRTFATEAEHHVYLQALDDYDGWFAYCHTAPVTTQQHTNSITMITLTAIFGQDAVTEYENTGIIPSTDKEFLDGSQILQKKFSTMAERDAYIEALEESDGADNWRVIRTDIPTGVATKLQFRHAQNNLWTDFPQAPTVNNFNNDFPSEFMHNYYASNHVAWEDDMQRFINDELSLAEIQERKYDVTTKCEAQDEIKRLRQIIINETMENFLADLTAGKIEFRRVLIIQ